MSNIDRSDTDKFRIGKILKIPSVHYVPNKEQANKDSTKFFRNGHRIPTVETAAEALALLRTGSSVILCNQELYELRAGEDKGLHTNEWGL